MGFHGTSLEGVRANRKSNSLLEEMFVVATPVSPTKSTLRPSMTSLSTRTADEKVRVPRHGHLQERRRETWGTLSGISVWKVEMAGYWFNLGQADAQYWVAYMGVNLCCSRATGCPEMMERRLAVRWCVASKSAS
jgi:hypothetical protein